MDTDLLPAWYFLNYARACHESELIHRMKKDVANPRMRGLIANDYEQFDQLAKRHFMELHTGPALGKRWRNSAKPMIFFHKLLRKWWPEASFVFVLRDPRDVLASYLHQDWPEHQSNKCPDLFSQTYLKFFRSRHLPGVVTVPYHEMIRDPGVIFRALNEATPEEPLRGIGEIYGARTLPPLRKEERADELVDRTGRWKTELNRDQIQIIEKNCKEVFDEFTFS